MKNLKIAVFILSMFAGSAFSAIQQGSNGVWYGNICHTPVGWAYVNYQPVGTICTVITPSGPIQGIILAK